jgi:hypothetical protein
MASIGINDVLRTGQVYTLSFKPSFAAELGGAMDLSALTAPLQYIDGISGVQVITPALFSGQVDVHFTYSGDGADASAMVQAILNAWDNAISFGSFTWIGATTTTTGLGTVAPDLSGLVPSSSSLWALAVIALVAVFVFSGGAGVVRRAVS